MAAYAQRSTSTVQELSSSLVRQAEAAGERLQSLATQLRETLRTSDPGSLFGNGIESARSYLGERELGTLGRDALDMARRYPVQTLLLAASGGWLVARFGRRATTRSGFRTRLKDVMTRHVEVVRPDAPLREAAAKMADLDVGAIPVCDGERLVGMLTDRDITIRAVARGADANQTPVRDVMTGTVRYCFEDEPIERAGVLMKKGKIRRLPILDANHRLVGIVALGDLAVDADVDEAGEVLERVSSPARPTRH